MTLHTKLFGLGFLACLALMVTALFMQYQMGLEPCPLCMMQRLAFIGIGVSCLLALVFRFSIWRKVCAALVAAFALAGIGFAGRQLWLQSLPADQVPVCGPGFEYMVNNFPLAQAFSMILSGSGECAEVQWVFLGLSIPGWSMVFFVGMLVAGLFLLFSKSPLKN